MAVNYRQPLNVQRFVRFYDGQHLKAQDFVDDQKYRAAQERKLTRLLLGEGIANGLNMGLVNDRQILQVSPGVAVERQGQLVEVTAEASLEVPADASEDVETDPYHVYVSYRRVASELRDDDSATGGGVHAATRWEEHVEVHLGRASTGGLVDDADDSLDEVSPVVIGTLIAPNGVVEVLPKLSGLAYGGEGAQPAIYWSGDGHLDVAGHLAAWNLTVSNELQAQTVVADELETNQLRATEVAASGHLTFSKPDAADWRIARGQNDELSIGIANESGARTWITNTGGIGMTNGESDTTWGVQPTERGLSIERNDKRVLAASDGTITLATHNGDASLWVRSVSPGSRFRPASLGSEDDDRLGIGVWGLQATTTVRAEEGFILERHFGQVGGSWFIGMDNARGREMGTLQFSFNGNVVATMDTQGRLRSVG